MPKLNLWREHCSARSNTPCHYRFVHATSLDRFADFVLLHTTNLDEKKMHNIDTKETVNKDMDLYNTLIACSMLICVKRRREPVILKQKGGSQWKCWLVFQRSRSSEYVTAHVCWESAVNHGSIKCVYSNLLIDSTTQVSSQVEFYDCLVCNTTPCNYNELHIWPNKPCTSSEPFLPKAELTSPSMTSILTLGSSWYRRRWSMKVVPGYLSRYKN